MVSDWRQVLQIIQPDALPRWHREGFRQFWKLKSRVQAQTHPQWLAPETIAWIERMALETPLGGGTHPRRVVEVEPPGGKAGDPEVQTGGALETVVGAILVDVAEDGRKDAVRWTPSSRY